MAFAVCILLVLGIWCFLRWGISLSLSDEVPVSLIPSRSDTQSRSEIEHPAGDSEKL